MVFKNGLYNFLEKKAYSWTIYAIRLREVSSYTRRFKKKNGLRTRAGLVLFSFFRYIIIVPVSFVFIGGVF